MSVAEAQRAVDALPRSWKGSLSRGGWLVPAQAARRGLVDFGFRDAEARRAVQVVRGQGGGRCRLARSGGRSWRC
jgi:hypothetical protein